MVDWHVFENIATKTIYFIETDSFDEGCRVLKEFGDEYNHREFVVYNSSLKNLLNVMRFTEDDLVNGNVGEYKICLKRK